MAYDKNNGRPNRKGRKKVCSFCVDKVESIDYKDVNKLNKYTSDRAKILPRRVTGTCAKHQRELTTAIKRARHVALMPYTSDRFNSYRTVAFAAVFFYYQNCPVRPETF